MNREQFNDQFKRFCQMSEADGRFSPKEPDQIAVLDEDVSNTTIHISWDYFIHCSWAARQLARLMPNRHVDIGSYVYFSGVASAFIPQFEFYDMRPIDFPLPALTCGSANLIDLHWTDNSIPSLSCMHSLEHVGLGRYGDELDAKGDFRAAAQLSRVLQPGGELLMVLPMCERPRVNYNAHRIYSFQMAMELFKQLHCSEFTVLCEEKVIKQPKNFPAGDYTGCFVFTKL